MRVKGCNLGSCTAVIVVALSRLQNLLTEYGNRLANLTHLDVGACRCGLSRTAREDSFRMVG